LRIQRPFFNQRLLFFKTELIGLINPTRRVLKTWFQLMNLSDNSKLKGGLDWAFGELDGPIWSNLKMPRACGWA